MASGICDSTKTYDLASAGGHLVCAQEKSFGVAKSLIGCLFPVLGRRKPANELGNRLIGNNLSLPILSYICPKNSMQVYSIETGYFKLDGGAMFGVVPKSIWHKLIPADQNNMCSWAMRCLLIEDGKRLVLVDTGIGSKQDAKFFGYYDLHGQQTLEDSLAKLGFGVGDITDVFLTHLHFDHCGGAIRRDGERLAPAFPNARFWSNEDHWRWATQPNAREKASFLAENIQPIAASGQLSMVEGNFFEGLFEVFFAHGHTDAMMCPIVDYKGHKLVYCADLIPSHAHIPVAYVMGYDTRPLLTMDEKKSLLMRAAEQGMILVFEHGVEVEACTLAITDKGIKMDRALRVSEL